jgi:hypothetical protein
MQVPWAARELQQVHKDMHVSDAHFVAKLVNNDGVDIPRRGAQVREPLPPGRHVRSRDEEARECKPRAHHSGAEGDACTERPGREREHS